MTRQTINIHRVIGEIFSRNDFKTSYLLWSHEIILNKIRFVTILFYERKISLFV